MEFAEFVKCCVLHEQTEVVRILIENEKTIDIQECIYNSEAYIVKFPDGEVSIGSTVFCRNVDNLGYNNRENHEYYEKAEYYSRTICSWWLVPYWLGKKLIDINEPVFRHYGCSWWGICNLQYVGWFNSKALQAVYKELQHT